MPRGESLIEAITLSLFLTRTRLRARLLDHDVGAAAHAADQRRGVDLARLSLLLRNPPAHLADDGRICRARAAGLLEAAEAAGIVAVAWRDSRYPARLTVLEDPPAVVWVRGRVDSLARASVAIVGSRAASHYALAVAERLASDVSRQGVAVVSGLARGVDAAAHRGALAGRGSTVAVLGAGVDISYPADHAALAASIAEKGALVSELAPGTPPLPHHFPRRNRLISGLALGVVVVEAAARSGSLITAGCAAEQGREVMAVPGNILSGRSRGAHALIRDGAKIVETADDILEELRLTPTVRDTADTPAGEPVDDGNSRQVSDPVLRHMDAGEIYALDDLTTLSGLDGADLLARLTDLEVEGRVMRLGAGRFVRSRDGMLT